VATATGGTALSQAQASAKAICDCLKTGQGVAEAVASAAASGNAQAAAQAIAEAAGGENSLHVLYVTNFQPCMDLKPSKAAQPQQQTLESETVALLQV
jgi:hypothetical protein